MHKRLHSTFAVVWLTALCGLLGGGIAAADSAYQLQSDTLQATVSEDAALLTLGRSAQENLIARPVEVMIREPLADMAIPDKHVRPSEVSRQSGQLRIRKQLQRAELAWTHRFQISSSLSWTITFENQSDRLRSLTVEFPLRLRGTDYSPFFTGENDYPEWPQDGKLSYSFRARSADRNELSIPLACLYAPQRDVGFSVAADLDIPMLPVEITAERLAQETEILFAHQRVRLDPHGSRSFTVHLLVHPGDWRCSLGWLRERWPEVFWVPEGLEKYQNMSYGGSGALGNYYPYCLVNDLFWKNYELHFSPWRAGVIEMMGLKRWWGWGWAGVSDTDRWLPGIACKWRHMQHYPEAYPEGFLDGMPPADAPYQEIVRFVESRPITPELREKLRKGPGHSPCSTCWEWIDNGLVRQYIDTIHANGYFAFLYWNPRDVWYSYARAEFADTLIRGPVDEYGYAWSVCNPCPGSKFWQHKIAEIERMLKFFPKLDGIFIDQCYGGAGTSGYDDGVSINEEGQPYSDFNRNLGRLCKEVAQRVHAAGKHVWQNHCHEHIDVTRYCDLALTEGRLIPGEGQEITRYLTIGNRAAVSLQNREPHLQVALRDGFYAGLWWNRPDPREQRMTLWLWAHRLYYPLFDLLRGRHWVLQPHCLEIPTGMDGNLFQRPDGNYVAVVVSPGETHITPWWRVNVPLVVRVPDADQIKAAYLISGDHLGPMKIPYERAGNAITVRLPHYRSAAALLLAKTGRFVSLASAPIVPRNGSATITLAVDNLTDEVWKWRNTLWVEGERWWRWQDLPANSQITEDFSVPTTVTEGDPFFVFRLAMDAISDIPSPDGKPDNYATFELLAEDGPAVTIAPPRKLITRCLSNSSQGGYLPFYEALPLHIFVGETAQFEVAIINSANSTQQITVDVAGSGLSVKQIDRTVEVPAGGARQVLVKATGQEAGNGTLTATVRSASGEDSFVLPIQIVGTKLSQSQLTAVKSVDLVADIWGQTAAEPKKAIVLNGTEVGSVSGAGGGPNWTTRVRIKLTEAAAEALQVNNKLEIRNPGDNFKVRNPLLVITLDDGSVFHLNGDQVVRSTSPEWSRAEGQRVAAKQPLTWRIPAQ